MNKAWNGPGGTLNPTSIKELRVPRKPVFDETEWTVSPKLRLLPDAKYVLIARGNSIGIWDIERAVLIGTTPTHSSYNFCLEFNVDVVRGGKELVIAGIFCGRGPETDHYM